MTDEIPIACSLDAADLQRRLEEISKLGAESLVARETGGDRHLLRFRNDAVTRARLEAIVAAETQCCAFLDLSLAHDGDELVLSIVAPDGAQPIAAQLANAFKKPCPQ
jgi:hypothetical protein